MVSELSTFLSLLPLAFQDCRAPLSGVSTASAASLTGGGLCASDGLTAFGESFAKGQVRGEILRDLPDQSVVAIGLFPTKFGS